MKKKNTIIMIGILLAGCNTLPATTSFDRPSSISQATGIMITYPYEGQHLALGEMCDVKSDASSPNTLQAVSLMVNGIIYRHDEFSGGFTDAIVYLPWTPKTPGIYTLQTLQEEHGGIQTSSNIVTVYVDQITPEVAVEIPITQPLEEELEECPVPIATTNAYANCRSGPGTAYALVEGLKPDRSFQILGRSSTGNWWQVERNKDGSTCWIWSNLVDTCGNTETIETVRMKEMDEAIEPEVSEEVKPDEEPIKVPPKIPTKDPGSGPTTMN